MPVSTRRLVQIAGWGGLIVSTTGFYLQYKFIDKIRSYDYYKDALKSLRRHPGAVHYLGEPIKDKRFKISDTENNYSDSETARFRVPVVGTKDREYKMFVGASKEKFFYHNTLLCLVRSLEDKAITVDLRNDSYVCGKVTSVDGFMNISFANSVFVDPQGNEYSFDQLFIQGRNIRYVHIPETISMLHAIKNELKTQKVQKNSKKPVEKSRKAKKALQRHMETVASLDIPTKSK